MLFFIPAQLTTFLQRGKTQPTTSILDMTLKLSDCGTTVLGLWGIWNFSLLPLFPSPL